MRLIDADALMKEFADFVRASNNSDFEPVPTWNDAVSLVGSMPSAEPEIIRCKDCKHYYYADNRIPEERRYACDLDGDRWSPDSFCNFAERRTDERSDFKTGCD